MKKHSSFLNPFYNLVRYICVRRFTDRKEVPETGR